MPWWAVWVVVLGALLTSSGLITCLSPYRVLQVPETASMNQIDKQYRKMRSRNRRSRSRKLMIKQAYNQILFERQFNAKEDV